MNKRARRRQTGKALAHRLAAAEKLTEELKCQLALKRNVERKYAAEELQTMAYNSLSREAAHTLGLLVGKRVGEEVARLVPEFRQEQRVLTELINVQMAGFKINELEPAEPRVHIYEISIPAAYRRFCVRGY